MLRNSCVYHQNIHRTFGDAEVDLGSPLWCVFGSVKGAPAKFMSESRYPPDGLVFCGWIYPRKGHRLDQMPFQSLGCSLGVLLGRNAAAIIVRTLCLAIEGATDHCMLLPVSCFPLEVLGCI